MWRAILQHLRFPFSLLLMPVYFFALSEMSSSGLKEYRSLILLFIILHLLVYPSSNAYNSIQDRDQGSIGLVRNPLPVPSGLYPLVNLMDLAAALLSLFIHLKVAGMVLVYIVFSRLYSYRGIRLKQYAIPAFLTVFVFQGAWIYIMVRSIDPDYHFLSSLPLAFTGSCLIGAIYPLSQVYQHRQDKADGVNSLSALLGYRGTFLFSAILFISGTLIYVLWQIPLHHMQYVWILLAFQGPVVLYFLYWFALVWKDTRHANFEHTMRLNILASLCMNLCFMILCFVG